jgi:hypothetical protein
MTRAIALAACLAAGMSTACWADDLKATPKFTDTQIGFEPGGTYGNFTLTMTGPNGIHASVSSKTGAPSIDLVKLGARDDGIYNYQLTASTDEKVPVRTGLDNGRGGRPVDSVLRSVSLNGQFEVKGGTIVKFDPNARETPQRQK